MKIVRIVGNVFVNTVPAEVGTTVVPGDMLDARAAEAELDNGNVYTGFCGAIDGEVVADTTTPTPTVSAVEQPVVEAPQEVEAPVVTKV